VVWVCKLVVSSYPANSFSGVDISLPTHPCTSSPEKSQNILYAADISKIEKTRLLGRVCCIQLVLYLGRCNLSLVFVIREHHGHAITQR
jgi:hypothetical protein